MSKVIPINSCAECPHRDHKGAFGRVSYVPVCRKTRRNLPHKVEEYRGNLTAHATNVIPRWCELEDAE